MVGSLVQQRAFARGVTEHLNYYVYGLRDPLCEQELFYVGKGKGDRAYCHANFAKKFAGESEQDLKLGRIRTIHEAGKSVQIEVIRHGMDEGTAFEAEAAVIDALRIGGRLTNQIRGQGIDRGWMPLDALVDKYGAQQKRIEQDHRVVLIRINKLFRYDMSECELYEATRKWWAANPAPRKPEWAFAVCYGIVRAVYRIERWEWSPADWNPRRCAFHGERDVEMETLYLGKDVTMDFKRGTQNPITYVHC